MLAGRRLIWRKYIRLFTDAGFPKFRLFPKVRRLHYSTHWGMYGFAVCFLGREFNFSFGEDKNNLYKRKE